MNFQAKSTKKKLFTQNSLLSETPIGTPEYTQSSQQYLGYAQKKTKTRTKIVKKGSLIIAQPPSPACTYKENAYPNTATQVTYLKNYKYRKTCIKSLPLMRVDL